MIDGMLAKVPEDRQAWIEQRLQELAQIFAVGVGGFSVMDNHLNFWRFARPSISTRWPPASCRCRKRVPVHR